MVILLRRLTAIGLGLLAAASSLAQNPTADAEPDVHTKMKAVQIYLFDGSAVVLARACNDSIPDFMSEFLPRFTHWRAANWKLIALGTTLSAQFKDDKGAPMDSAAVGKALAQQLRGLAPDARRQECNKLLQDVASARQAD